MTYVSEILYYIYLNRYQFRKITYKQIHVIDCVHSFINKQTNKNGVTKIGKKYPLLWCTFADIVLIFMYKLQYLHGYWQARSMSTKDVSCAYTFITIYSWCCTWTIKWNVCTPFCRLLELEWTPCSTCFRPLYLFHLHTCCPPPRPLML